MFDLKIRKRFGRFELDVSCRSEAQVLGVVGPSGSGKSTLLNVIAGLETADHAEVAVMGTSLITASRRAVAVHRRGVGYVCQDPLLFPHLTVGANLRYGLGAHGCGPGFDEVVALLELGPLVAQSARTLSGGESRRVAIARAVLSAPRVLLLDEPLGGLDARLAARTLALLHRVHTSFHIPTIYVSHTASDVVFLCDEAWRLENGRVVARGSPRDMLAGARASDPAAWTDLHNYVLARQVVDAGGGGCQFRIGSQTLAVADANRSVDASTETAVLSVHAGDIMLARERPRRISARNVLPGRVSRLDERDSDVLVWVEAGTVWMVRITASARRELELAPGVELFVIVKASAISAVRA
jgi:molybdate transport system ATP-binding protein